MVMNIHNQTEETSPDYYEYINYTYSAYTPTDLVVLVSEHAQ